MISRPKLWYQKSDGRVLGVGYSTFAHDRAKEAVTELDAKLFETTRFEFARFVYFRGADGSVAAQPKPPTPLEELREKRRAGKKLTAAEQQELLDLLLGV